MILKLSSNEKRKFESNVIQNVAKDLQKRMFDIQREAIRNSPVDTGRLKNSIRSSSDRKSIIISANTNYAEYVEFARTRGSPSAKQMRNKFFMKRAIKKVMNGS